MSLKFGLKSDVGRKRRTNQDSCAIVRGETLNGELDALFVIADGMGGTQGGEVASEIVVQTVPDSVTAALAARNGYNAPLDAPGLLHDAVEKAHRQVRERQAAETRLSGMGTTCVAALLDANILTIANVGDSRAYLLRDGKLTQITEDHSSVWEQVLAGNMTAEEARTSRFRNQITRAIGSEVNAEPDIDTVELREGDSVLLCTDGLTSELDDAEIARLLAGVSDPQAACDALVEAALDAGGRDNVTVIALRYGAFTPLVLERAPAAAAAPEPAADPLEAWRGAGYDPTARQRDLLGSSREYRTVGRPAVSPALLGLLFLLAILAGGEGYALIRLDQRLEQLRSRPPEVVVRAPSRPTDRELRYGAAVAAAAKLVRDAPLAVDEEGAAIAASLDGTLIRIDRSGHITRLPDQMRIAPADSASARPALLLATDASGNRYQVNPGAKVIAKYDPDGTLREGRIGEGTLVAPTALAVDAAGNLFVIDERRVKKIAASDARLQADAPAGR